jgi:hypothetical protein
VSSIRGRVVKHGGMATDYQGATSRTESGPGNLPITRPAYRVSQGVSQPAGVGGANLAGYAGGGHPLVDFSGVTGWRTLFAVAALFWLGFVAISLGRGGVAGGVRL